MIRLSGKEPERDIAIEFVGVAAGREAARGAVGRRRGRSSPTAAPEDPPRVARPTIDPAWLEDELAELERLVAEGDTLEARLAARGDGARAAARRCRDATRSDSAQLSQLPPGRPGGDPRRAEPRAAARGRGRPRAGLHPRRRRLGQDDDDHAPDRAPGRDRRVSRRTRSSPSPSPTRPRARCARGWQRSASTGVARAHVPRRRARAAPPLRARARSARSSPSKALLAAPDRERAAGAVPLPAARATSRPRSSGRRTGACRRRRYRDGARRARAADPRRPDAARLPRATRSASASGARSTSRTCSSCAIRIYEEDEHALAGVPRALPRVHGRRVPGRQPAPADAARALARRPRRPLRRRRRLPVDLRASPARRREYLLGDAVALPAARRSSGWRRTTARRRRCSRSRTGSCRSSAAPRRRCARRGRGGPSPSCAPFATPEAEAAFLVERIRALPGGRAARGDRGPLPDERALGRLRGGASRRAGSRPRARRCLARDGGAAAAAAPARRSTAARAAQAGAARRARRRAGSTRRRTKARRARS